VSSLIDDPAAAPRSESVSERYLVTLAAQVLRVALAFVAAAIVPRVLGPIAYGNYTFLLSTSSTLRAFLDNGTQQAFFTFSARDARSGGLTRLYAGILAAQFLITMLLIGGLAAADRLAWLWPGQALDEIVAVTALEWTLFLAATLQQLGDSKAHTIYPQLLGTLAAVAVLIGLLALWATGRLDFDSFVWLNLAGGIMACALLGHWLIGRHADVFWRGALALPAIAKRWWRFASPLLLLQYYTPIVAYAGLYFIQRWYGSAELGHYGLALQWSALAMIFTNASITIFWREIAHHTASGALHRAAAAYEQFGRLFFVLVFAVACWLSVASGTLVRAVAGEQFSAAAVVLAIMAFYPVAQTLGQLTATSLKALERTGTYARWTVYLSVPDLLLTYFLIAPANAPVPGLGLGAVGLAIKTALYGLFGVHLLDWLNCRVLGIDYAALFRARIVVSLGIGAVAVSVIGGGGSALEAAGVSGVTALIATSVGYAAIIGAVLWFRPTLAGVTHEQLRRALRLGPFRRRAHAENGEGV
jgi:O-antigen/teichoic acid export membrane protein